MSDPLAVFAIESLEEIEYICDDFQCGGPAIMDRCLKCGGNSVTSVDNFVGVTRDGLVSEAMELVR